MRGQGLTVLRVRSDHGGIDGLTAFLKLRVERGKGRVQLLVERREGLVLPALVRCELLLHIVGLGLERLLDLVERRIELLLALVAVLLHFELMRGQGLTVLRVRSDHGGIDGLTAFLKLRVERGKGRVQLLVERREGRVLPVPVGRELLIHLEPPRLQSLVQGLGGGVVRCHVLVQRLEEGLAHVRGALQARVHVRAELLAILRGLRLERAQLPQELRLLALEGLLHLRHRDVVVGPVGGPRELQRGREVGCLEVTLQQGLLEDVDGRVGQRLVDVHVHGNLRGLRLAGVDLRLQGGGDARGLLPVVIQDLPVRHHGLVRLHLVALERLPQRPSGLDDDHHGLGRLGRLALLGVKVRLQLIGSLLRRSLLGLQGLLERLRRLGGLGDLRPEAGQGLLARGGVLRRLCRRRRRLAAERGDGLAELALERIEAGPLRRRGLGGLGLDGLQGARRPRSLGLDGLQRHVQAGRRRGGLGPDVVEGLRGGGLGGGLAGTVDGDGSLLARRADALLHGGEPLGGVGALALEGRLHGVVLVVDHLPDLLQAILRLQQGRHLRMPVRFSGAHIALQLLDARRLLRHDLLLLHHDLLQLRNVRLHGPEALVQGAADQCPERVGLVWRPLAGRRRRRRCWRQALILLGNHHHEEGQDNSPLAPHCAAYPCLPPPSTGGRPTGLRRFPFSL